MVLLTITNTVVEALGKLRSLEGENSETTNPQATSKEDDAHASVSVNRLTDSTTAAAGTSLELSILHPTIGDPISHSQVVRIWEQLKRKDSASYTLEDLLKGSRIYILPPPAKPEPTSEYKALMARLRRQEEERTYDRMTNPSQPMETFSQKYPAASAARAFASSHRNIGASDPDDDGLTYADVDRQIGLILNVLLSIVACAGAIWVAARWWSTPARLAISMSGSILVGVAEVVVYSGYIRRLGEARGKEKAIKEIKEVVTTWVVGANEDLKDTESVVNIEPRPSEDVKVRRRK